MIVLNINRSKLPFFLPETAAFTTSSADVDLSRVQRQHQRKHARRKEVGKRVPAPGNINVYTDLNRDWSPRFSTLRDKNGWIRAKTARNLNIGVSRNRFCDYLADPGSRSFSRFYANMIRSRYIVVVASVHSTT